MSKEKLARVEQIRADLRQMVVYHQSACRQAGMTAEQGAADLEAALEKLHQEFGPQYVDVAKLGTTGIVNPKRMLERLLQLMQKDTNKSVQAYLRSLLDIKTALGW